MPFAKGHQFSKGNKGGGRKGYAYEHDKKSKMRELYNEVLKLAGKIEKGQATEDEIRRFQILLKMVLKIMDKLFPNKQEHDIRSEARVFLEGVDDF